MAAGLPVLVGASQLSCTLAAPSAAVRFRGGLGGIGPMFPSGDSSRSNTLAKISMVALNSPGSVAVTASR